MSTFHVSRRSKLVLCKKSNITVFLALCTYRNPHPKFAPEGRHSELLPVCRCVFSRPKHGRLVKKKCSDVVEK